MCTVWNVTGLFQPHKTPADPVNPLAKQTTAWQSCMQSAYLHESSLLQSIHYDRGNSCKNIKISQMASWTTKGKRNFHTLVIFSGTGWESLLCSMPLIVIYFKYNTGVWWWWPCVFVQGVISILHILLLIFSVQVCVLQNQILHSHYLWSWYNVLLKHLLIHTAVFTVV